MPQKKTVNREKILSFFTVMRTVADTIFRVHRVCGMSGL